MVDGSTPGPGPTSSLLASKGRNRTLGTAEYRIGRTVMPDHEVELAQDRQPIRVRGVPEVQRPRALHQEEGHTR